MTTITDSDTVLVHNTCRSNYIHKMTVAASKRKSLPTLTVRSTKRKLRRSSSCSSVEMESVDGSCDWEDNCLICRCEANIEKEKKYPINRRKRITLVQSSDFQTNSLKILSSLNDDAHREIFKRISGARDVIILKG